MANIIFNNYCNLKCPYCFANDCIQEEKYSISKQQLNKILNFIQKTPTEKIGIIGGEPTLHPNFPELIKELNTYVKNNDSGWVLFSNGIELYKYVDLFKNNKNGCLLNLNHPNIVGKENWQKIIKTLITFNKEKVLHKITLGINLYENLESYDFFLKTATFFKMPIVRVSVVAPTNLCATTDKDLYYIKMKKLFLSFLKDAKQQNIKVNLDCNKIPLCYFNNQEQELISEVCDPFNSFCDPVIDINANFQATSCFGAYHLIDLTNFNNLNEVKRYFLFYNHVPLTQINKSQGKCSQCDNKICQGGCLAFAKNAL